jgi:hypothetical protein
MILIAQASRLSSASAPKRGEMGGVESGSAALNTPALPLFAGAEGNCEGLGRVQE